MQENASEPKLPPPSWGGRLAGRIQGLTLVILALGVLLTAFGKLDDALTTKQKDDILRGFYAFGLIEPPKAEPPIRGQKAAINYNNSRHKDIAILTIPNNVTIRSYRNVFDDGPACEAHIDPPVPQNSDRFGVIILTSEGVANGCDGRNSGAAWHVEADVVKKDQPLTFTPIGKIAFAFAIFVGLISTFRGRTRRSRQRLTEGDVTAEAKRP